MSELDIKLSQRNKILDEIQEKKDFIEGKIFKPLLDKISAAKKERSALLIEFSEKQLYIRKETNPTKLLKIEKELNSLCDKLSDIDFKIKELNDELKSLRKKSASTPLTQLESELNKLNDNLNKVNEDIADVREQERKKQEEKNRNKKYSLDLSSNSNSNYQKVIIDDQFGIYINYPKGDVMSTTIGCIFGSGMNTIPEDYPISKSDIVSSISNLNVPGLPTLLNMFIDILLKAIGQGFVKQFYFFKNTIDMLAGLQFGELLGTYIPGLPKIIKDIKMLLIEPENWMFQKMLGPLFDINIPIPDFKIDLGSLIPFLPFSIKIPSIDPWGYYDKATPFNVNVDPKDIPLDWQVKMIEEANNDQVTQELEFANMRTKLIKDLNDKIKKLQDDINNYNKYTILKLKSERKIKVLNIQHDQIKYDIEKNKNLYGVDKLKIIEIKLSNFCDQINKETKKLEKLIESEIQEQKRLDSLDKDKLQVELNSLIDEKNDLKEQPNITLKDVKKRALLMAYEQKIKGHDLDIKLSNLWNIGVNVFNNKVTEYLQKIGYNFKDEKYIDKILKLKNYGFKFNDSTHLERLYELGFSLNDPNHMSKLQLLKQYNIDIFNTEILLLFIEMGMNFNNNYFKSVIEGLNNLGVSLKDIEIMKKLNTLGFNFNNPRSPERLKILGKYIDITTSFGYDNALSRNVNLNNPYFEDVLIRYNKIGLTWDKKGVENFDKEIRDNVKKEDVNLLIDVVNYYKNKDGNLNIIKNIFNDSSRIEDNKTYVRTDTSQLSNSSDDIFNNINFNLSRFGEVYNPNIPDEQTEIVSNTNIINKQGEIYSYDVTYYNEPVYVAVPITGTTAYTYELSSYDVTTGNTRVYWVSLFDFDINRYSKFGIKIDLPVIYSNKKILKEYVYPNKSPIYSEKNKNGKLIILEKLELLKSFIDNGYKWVINGINISENYGQVDAQSIVDATDADRVPQLSIQEIKNGDNQVSYAELKSIYGNFDKLGLNIRDPLFSDKMNILSHGLKLRADESVMLDVSRKVIMSYYDYKNNNEYKTIDLSTTKIDPKFFENDRYKSSFKVTNIIDSNMDSDKIPTKTLVKFDSLNKLGFNFQQYKINNGEEIETYADNINLLIGLQFDISKFQTSDIVDSLCAIGWNFSIKDSIEKIQALKKFGFNFFIQPDNQGNSTLEELKFKDMDGKLNSLCNFGFHFENLEWKIQLNEMKNLGISLSENDFDSIVGELNAFGINLKDNDWRLKLIKIGQLGINFSSSSEFNTQTVKVGDKKWVAQMSNLSMMGIDFSKEDWLTEYDKAISFKQLGIDYTDVENRQKIAILVKLGIDFEKPRDDYMQKLESLVKLKLITIPNSIEKQKTNYLIDRKNKLTNIQNDINKLKSILNGDIISELDLKTNHKRKQQSQLLNEINRLKSIDMTNMNGVEITNILTLTEKYCNQMEYLNDDINSNLENREKYKKMNKIDIEKQISILEKKKLDLDNKVYLMNSDIGLSELDKFKGLDKLGINYYDPDWIKNIDKLLKVFDFSMPDWKSLLNDVKDLIPKNPILQWKKSLIDILITLITMPLKTLIGIIKSFLNLIKSVVSIPLNPTKIPKWSINIIKKFMDLIKMITGLPTLEGILDFLFMNKSGLMLIDIFIPGFAEFAENLKKIVKDYKEKSKQLREIIKNKKEELNNLKNSKIKRTTELENKLKMLINALNGDINITVNKENIKLKNKKEIFNRNIDFLKKITKDTKLSQSSLDIIEKELKRNCDVIKDIDKLIDNNNKDKLLLYNKSEDDLKKDVSNLTKQLNNLDSVYDIDTKEKEIKNINNESDDLLDKAKKLGNFCKLKDNLNIIMELLRGMIDLEKNKKNPYDDQIKSKKDKLNKLKDELSNVDEQLNGFTDNVIDLRRSLDKLNKQIKNMSDYICNDDNSRANISKLQNLEKLRDALIKKIDRKEKLKSMNNSELLDKKKFLQNDMLKLQNEVNNLKDKSKEFKEKNDNKLLELGEIDKWFTVIINIICCTPKFIANILVELLNSAGHMENLPSLWEFPLIK